MLVTATISSSPAPATAEQDARVVDDEVPGLGQDVGAGLDRVADGHDDDVGDHEVDRPEADEPVPARELVLAVGPFDQRDPGHQQHLDQQQVRGDETGEAAYGGQPGAPAGEVLDVAARRPRGRRRPACWPRSGRRRASRPHSGRAAGRRASPGDGLGRRWCRRRTAGRSATAVIRAPRRCWWKASVPPRRPSASVRRLCAACARVEPATDRSAPWRLGVEHRRTGLGVATDASGGGAARPQVPRIDPTMTSGKPIRRPSVMGSCRTSAPSRRATAGLT